LLSYFLIDFTTWPQIAPQSCNGSKQSPIDIKTTSVQGDPKLTSFTFTGFDDNSTFMSIANSGDSGKKHGNTTLLGPIYLFYFFLYYYGIS